MSSRTTRYPPTMLFYLHRTQDYVLRLGNVCIIIIQTSFTQSDIRVLSIQHDSMLGGSLTVVLLLKEWVICMESSSLPHINAKLANAISYIVQIYYSENVIRIASANVKVWLNNFNYTSHHLGLHSLIVLYMITHYFHASENDGNHHNYYRLLLP